MILLSNYFTCIITFKYYIDGFVVHSMLYFTIFIKYTFQTYNSHVTCIVLERVYEINKRKTIFQYVQVSNKFGKLYV